MTPEAERFNGWAAMVGIIAAFGAYALTGQIIPGLWQMTDFVVDSYPAWKAILWIFYPIGALVAIELFLRAVNNNDDDDDGGGGMMIPAYAPR